MSPDIAAPLKGLFAAGIVRRTTDRPPPRRVVPIAAHLVFGLATAYAYEALSAEPDGDRT